MGIATDFVLGVREAFTLEHARRAACAEGDARDLARQYVAASRARRSAARRASYPPVAVTLLRDALELAILAARPGTSVDLRDELGARDDVVGEWLASPSRLFVEDLPFERAEALRDALDAEVTARVDALDVRSSNALRALRIGRFGALALVVTLGVAALVRAKLLPHDVALGKPVLTSGLRSDPVENGAGVVDGRTHGTFGIQTTESAHSFVTIDLTRPLDVTRVRVFNRGDGWYDESLPLAIEISDDNAVFREVARRTTHFDVWTTDVHARARFVRVAKLTPGAITLNEIEIYSRD